MVTLGINAAFHDSAACLVIDGRVVAAAEEERFNRVKHGKRPIPFSTYELPYHAIDYCLEEAGLDMSRVDHVAYSYDPALRLQELKVSEVFTLPVEPSAHRPLPGCDSPWDPLFLCSIVNAPRQLRDGAPHHLLERFRDGGNGRAPYRWHFVEHHLAHSASAFHTSPFETAAVMTLDGRGERITTSYSVGRGSDLTRLTEVEMPHSLGLLYEDVTAYLGFLHSSDEYKVMALASYGRPVHERVFRDAVRPGVGGMYEIQKIDFEREFGPRRRRGEPIEQRHFDIARSLQAVLEDTVLALARWLHRETGEKNLCMAGGVALNCVMNGRLRDRGPFDRIWIQPAAGDAGTALGAALWIDAQFRRAARRVEMEHAYLGPAFSDEEIEKFLKWTRQPYRRSGRVEEDTAEILRAGKIIGWFQGRMEFGPRALGSRSILASPIEPSMQQKLNFIKDREDFRPVAPVVLEEEWTRWFSGRDVSPFMLFIYEVLPEAAGRIPAVTHVDGTARVQTVNRSQHPRLYDLLKAFQRRTGVPVLVNTSFNTVGRPIVCTPRDAVETFWSSPLEALVIGSFIVEKGRAA
jgi:carbamoyltransferase